jgi:hypothetical protein
MAWVSTNKDVATSIIVTKTVIGQALTGYPKTYNLLDAFAAQPVITENEWQKMPYSQQLERITAFKNYINAQEGISVNGTQSNEPFRDSDITPGQIVEE